MIPLLTRESVRAVDQNAVENLGIPSILLMENAALGATQVILECFAQNLENLTIVAGPGQNGGDGWVIARQLYNRKMKPRLVLVGEAKKVKGDAYTNLQILRQLGLKISITAEDGMKVLAQSLDRASLVVDALFGTGLDRPIKGIYAEAIGLINESRAPCLALDLPSGIDANTGAILGTAIRANKTVTFAAHKCGLYHHPGAAFAGDVICASIGIPNPTEANSHLLELSDIAAWVPPRPPDSHKGSAGDILVVSGSPGRTGAALLSGLGALRTGAGLVTLASRGRARDALDAKVIELMTAEIPLQPPESCDTVMNLASGKASAVVGPGLGLDDSGRKLARYLAQKLPIPTVLDADALTAIGTDLSLLKRAKGPRVLTPHPGEAARLLNTKSSKIQANRYAAARSIAKQSNSIVVLKGANTVVAEPGGDIRVTDRGTPALAVAGTGDVLSGVVGSLLTSLQAFDAACAGVVLHALAGEIAARSDRGLLSREVADAIPEALEMCRNGDPAG